VGARLHLRARVGFNAGEITGGHLGGENFSARGIDAFADDDEGAIEADNDFPGGGTDDGVGHDAVL